MKALYVTDRAAIGDERFGELLDSLRGAARLSVQVREKAAHDRAYAETAARARQRLGPDVPVWVNRRFDVASAAGADGVHLPADGLPLARVRAAAPRGLRVGVSTHSAADAIRAIEGGADLVIVGPIFDTPSKRAFGSPLGVAELERLPLASEHASEVYAIGGIDAGRADQLRSYRNRIAGIAAIRLFQEAPDARALLERVTEQ
jgi:thiamine-phosphate pyrophosphorylase